MQHLAYKDTNNKNFKTYYDKFKKMVKQDLGGDGWFLLVKDFPFKDGPNLMFTAGEDLGKWPDKNLVSLYGKTNYILGRARKKGPVISLMDFQEGDYVKKATESGLRKELKEFFKGTGVSVRTFKSLKVSDPEPEIEENELPDQADEVQEDPGNEAPQAGAGATFEELEMPALKPTAIKALLEKAIEMAKARGVLDEQAFIDLVNAFKKAVPRKLVMKSALENINAYLKAIEPIGLSEPTTTTDESSDQRKQIQKQLTELEAEEQRIRKQALDNMLSLQERVEKEGPESIQIHVNLVEETENLLNQLAEELLTKKEELEEQLASL